MDEFDSRAVSEESIIACQYAENYKTSHGLEKCLAAIVMQIAQNVLFPIYRNFRLFSTISIKPTKYMFSYMHEPLRHAMNTIINNTYQCIAVTFFHGNLNAIGLRRYLTYGMGKQNLGIPR